MPRTGNVVGSSMSPSIPGEHYVVTCTDCRFSFTCDAEQSDKRQHWVCSNCGGNIDPANGRKHAATSVDIQQNPLPIERWDVVAFRMSADAETDKHPLAGIKRVVGLPGESIEIRDGNLWADGNIVRKSIEHQKALRIPVHDSAYRPAHDRRWAFDQGTGWQTHPSFRFDPLTRNTGVDWLKFVNLRNYSHTVSTSQPDESSPVEDFYGFNQSLGRDLNAMDDVFLELDATMSSGSLLAWQFDHRGTIYEFQIDTSRSAMLVTSTGAALLPGMVSIDAGRLAKPDLRIEFSSFDLLLSVWLDGNQIFRHELAESAAPVSHQLLKVGAAKNQLVLNRIRIWRDLYYFPVPGPAPTGPTKIRQNGYFVIGDNVPISVDSRHWQSPSLLRSDVIGKVISP